MPLAYIANRFQVLLIFKLTKIIFNAEALVIVGVMAPH